MTSDQIEIAGVKVRHRDPLQRHRAVVCHRDDGIGTRLRGLVQDRCEISEGRLIELDHVVALLEVGHRRLTGEITNVSSPPLPVKDWLPAPATNISLAEVPVTPRLDPVCVASTTLSIIPPSPSSEPGSSRYPTVPTAPSATTL